MLITQEFRPDLISSGQGKHRSEESFWDVWYMALITTNASYLLLSVIYDGEPGTDPCRPFSQKIMENQLVALKCRIRKSREKTRNG